MKKVATFSAFALFLAIGLSSCKKESLNDTMSEEEAVEAVEAMYKASEAGINAEYKTGTDIAEEDYLEYAANCSYGGDSTISYAQTFPNGQYAFTLNYLWDVSCNLLGIPQTLVFSSTRNGSYTGTRLQYTGTGNTDLSVGGLELAATAFTLNGSHTFTGTHTWVLRSRSVSTTFNSTMSAVTIDKTTQEITGGTGTFTLTAVGTDNTVSYDGTIVFLGGGSATVTINGTAYTISI